MQSAQQRQVRAGASGRVAANGPKLPLRPLTTSCLRPSVQLRSSTSPAPGSDNIRAAQQQQQARGTAAHSPPVSHAPTSTTNNNNTSTSSSSSADGDVAMLPLKQPQQQPDREPDTRLTQLLRLLSKTPFTSWLGRLAERLLKPNAGGTDQRALRLIRMVLALSVFCIVALFREASLQNSRTRPREVSSPCSYTALQRGSCLGWRQLTNRHHHMRVTLMQQQPPSKRCRAATKTSRLCFTAWA